MPDPAIATAADYADAMITARRAKNFMILILLLLLLAQITVFFLVRYDVIKIDTTTTTAAVAATTSPASSINWRDVWEFLSGTFLFLGLILTITLGLVLLLIVNIMLVGRLIGVARLTSAYIWCLLLLVILFPWQSFLNNVDLTPDRITWKWPGALYTWGELTHPTLGAKFPADFSPPAILKWARYVAWPLVAVIILLAIQAKSNRGMRQALGEDDIVVTPME